jgi:hypothetical protein
LLIRPCTGMQMNPAHNSHTRSLVVRHPNCSPILLLASRPSRLPIHRHTTSPMISRSQVTP